jgi:heptosyltransferase II
VLEGTPWLDEQWLLAPKAGQDEAHDWSLVSRMHQQHFDTVLFLERSFRATVLAWLGGAKQRVGYVRCGQGKLLTKRLEWPHHHKNSSGDSMVAHYFRLAEAIGCPSGSSELELATVERDEQSADLVWRNLGLRSDGRILLMNPAGLKGSAKLWPAEHFGALARRVASELNQDVLVLCGRKNREIARDIAKRASHARVFSLADQPLDLGTRKACIRRGRMMVSNESGERLIASAFGKPVITLSGPTLPEWSRLSKGRSSILSLDLDCIGCQNRVCPLRHHKCMQDLSVSMVYGEVAKLLEESLAACAA